MSGKTRPSLRQKTLENVKRSNLSETDKKCIEEVFKRYEEMLQSNEYYRSAKTMREILFRGKSIVDRKWAFGDFCNYNGTAHIKIENDLFKVIIPESIGQYTSLTDKNGTKIFEGDIVLAPYIDPIFNQTWNESVPTERAVVKFDEGIFYIEYLETQKKFTLNCAKGYIEVIGNIFDNPELLKGGDSE